MMNNRKTHTVVLRLAAALLVFVMLSFSMVAGRYARYVSTASGSDSARVAKFSVVETGSLLTEEISLKLIPLSSVEKTIVVTNDSEVAIEYKINADNPFDSIPLTFEVKLLGEGALNPVPYTGTLAPGEYATYILVTTWSGSNDISYSGKVDLVEITVSATQID